MTYYAMQKLLYQIYP